MIDKVLVPLPPTRKRIRCSSCILASVWLDPAWVVIAVWGVKQNMEDLFFFFPGCLFYCTFPINTYIFEEVKFLSELITKGLLVETINDGSEIFIHGGDCHWAHLPWNLERLCIMRLTGTMMPGQSVRSLIWTLTFENDFLVEHLWPWDYELSSDFFSREGEGG